MSLPTYRSLGAIGGVGQLAHGGWQLDEGSQRERQLVELLSVAVLVPGGQQHLGVGVLGKRGLGHGMGVRV